MSYKIELNASNILVTLRDDLTVADAKELRDELLAAAPHAMPILLDAENARRIDASIVQVLYAAQKTLGKLTVQGCSSEIRNYLELAGVTIESWTHHASADETMMKGAGNG